MYYPIIKNKLNELKGLEAVHSALNFIPILEIVDCKYEDHEKFFDSFMSKISSTSKNKRIFIDLPTYTDNDALNMFELYYAQDKFNFLLTLEQYFISKGYMPFIPVISFDYSYASQRESYKENIKMVKKISAHFTDGFAFRVFSDSSFKNEDKDLISQSYAFLDEDIIEKCYLIIDCDKQTFSDTLPLIKELYDDEFPIKNIILAGEAYNGSIKKETEILCGRIENIQLKRVQYIKTQLSLHDIHIDSINYADFSLLEKIQSKIEIDPDKGFLYYPFIKYTTEDGNLCMFTADTKGNYQQYEELCRRVMANIHSFSVTHCDTCQFISDVAAGSIDSFKAGSVWKHRMITHHITALAMLGV